MTKVGYLEPKSLSNCTDNIIKEDIILPAGETVDIDVRVWLSDTLQNTEIDKSFFAKLKVDGIAIYDKNETIDNDILSLSYMKKLFYETNTTTDYSYYRSEDYREYIKNVSFVNYINITNAVESWDVSIEENNTIVAWIENNETSGYYDLYIGSFQKIYSQSTTSLFKDMKSLENISFDNLDTSLTTDMSYMFYGCTGLVNLDLETLNTSNVTTMLMMFDSCRNLVSLNLSNFNTNSVRIMSWMFSGCNSLTSLDLSSFNTKNATTMRGMFYSCTNLVSLDLTGWDTSNVETMGSFTNDEGTYIAGIFENCPNLTTTIVIKNANTTYENMFLGSATTEGALITVNYTTETSNLVDSMIETKSETSNVIKGILVE